MEIVYGIDDLEMLDQFSYVYSRDVYRRGGLYYKFILSCKVCGRSFFNRVSYPSKFCSRRCANRDGEVRNKISRSLTGHKRTKSEVDSIIKRMSKGDVVKRNIPLYDTFNHQLVPVEETRDVSGVLQVKCSLCKCWFVPTRSSVENRCQFIKGNTDRESRFYCSDECKVGCSIFHKHKHPSATDTSTPHYFSSYELRVWSNEVLNRSKHTCEYCGKQATVAHHVLPKKAYPFFSLDPDNGIACCQECHYKYGHSDKCSPYRLSKTRC